MSNATASLIAYIFGIAFFLVLIGGPIYLAVTLANYNWLWLWVIALFANLPEYRVNKKLSDKEIAEACIREIKGNPTRYRELMNETR